MAIPDPFDTPEFAADPFGERMRLAYARSWPVLGASFVFASNSEALLALAAAAYDGLPAHRLAPVPPVFHIELRLVPASASGSHGEPGPVQTSSGGGMVMGMVDASNHVIVSPAQRRAVVTVSEDRLAYPYHVRYELIEFAVYLLAARGQDLVSLHAACIGGEGRGVLLLGPSGAGKSTLTLQAALDGYDVMAEDGVFVEPKRLRATGVPNYLHVTDESLRWLDPAARRMVMASPRIQRRSGVEKFEIDLRAGALRPAPEPLDIVATILLSAQRTDGPLLEPIARDDAMVKLAADQPYAARQPGWRRFVDTALLRGVWVLRRGADPRATLEALASWLSLQEAVG
ncbi:serine kinase [Luteibacter aegosomaticola]|uniref:serine kinase n=1 Tax=Luteibacter aegosomaticola TaxID=2911538 RepID=UPI001FF8D619|nr:serine kinase [Luteibacter aegosomaticola]UPG90955.1 serine kinase [Luteibacter aegosomaticola]